MNDNWEIFLQAYQKLSPEGRAIIDSEEISVLAANRLNQLGVYDEYFSQLRSLGTDILVGITNQSELDLIVAAMPISESDKSSLLSEFVSLIEEMRSRLQKVEAATNLPTLNNEKTVLVDSVPNTTAAPPQRKTAAPPQTNQSSSSQTPVSTWQPVGQTVPSHNPVPTAPPTPPPPVNPAPTQPVRPTVVPPATPIFTAPQPVTSPAPQPAPQTPRPSISDIESRMPPLPPDATPTPQWGSAPTPPITPPPATDIQPVRTMEHDAERIQGYSAYRQQYPHLYTDEDTTKETVRGLAQDALLQRAPVVDTPRFDEPRG